MPYDPTDSEAASSRSDPYAVLGLTRQATQEQIRRAYRTLMRQNHPDTRMKGTLAADAASNTTLQKLAGAYSVLGDPVRRAIYDHRIALQQTAPARPKPPAPRDPRRQPPIRVGPVRWHRAGEGSGR